MRFSTLSALLICTALTVQTPARAADQAADQAVPRPAMLNLARDFVARMHKGLDRADEVLAERERGAITGTDYDVRGLPDGEPLILRGILPGRIAIQNQFLGEVQGGRALVSLRDFTSNLEFAIEYAPDRASGSGWYIRQGKNFAMDSVARTVTTDQGSFDMSAAVRVSDNDILVPMNELGKWFGIKLTLDISSLEMMIESDPPLPMYERLQRHKRTFGHDAQMAKAELPRGHDEPKLIDVPMADVYSTTSYRKNGASGEVTKGQSTNIRTRGDFAYGTLTTQTQANTQDKLTGFTANYKKESVDPDLLGPLRARRFEAGDVIPTNLPLAAGSSSELGVRITNVDPLRSYTRPTTQITGNAPVGWDVELYRDQQLLGLTTVDDTGNYVFDDVALYRNDNNFRVVMYGPQGEQEEQNVYIPVDPSRLSDTGGAYDVTMSLDGRQTYSQNNYKDEDTGTPRIAALYEVPVGKSSAVSAGFRTQEESGDRRYYGHAGLSTTLGSFLMNADGAVDDRGEMAAEIVARRDFGLNDFRNSTRWNTDFYEIPDDDAIAVNGREIFTNTTNLTGPLPISFGLKPRYNLGFTYGYDTDGENRYVANAGVNTSFKRISVGQNVSYTRDDGQPDDQMNLVTTAAGSFGRNRIRLASDYEVKPDNTMNRMTATWLHRFNKDINSEFELEKRFQQDIVEGTAQVNWMAGFARISPSVSYNNDGDITARLNTNFGAAYDPGKNSVRFSDRGVTNGGAVSAFVYLDHNGDNIFNAGDEPLPEITVRSLQTGGRATTDEQGHAYIQNMTALRLSDVTIEESSLPDPFWVTGYKGASVIPREGAVYEMEFPVHIAGEMDGTVYLIDTGGHKAPLRDIGVTLYNDKGEAIKSAKTANDGFYLFERIPPGDYRLLVDAQDVARYKLQSPDPQPVHIGYEGTVIYGNDIILRGGGGSAPIGFIAGTADYLASNPQVDPAVFDHAAVIMNMGSYRSQLLMGLVWYKLRTRYGALLGDADLLVPPSQSYADPKTGKHELLLAVPGMGVAEAMRRCRMLAARGIDCGVELLPDADTPAQVAAAGN